MGYFSHILAKLLNCDLFTSFRNQNTTYFTSTYSCIYIAHFHFEHSYCKIDMLFHNKTFSTAPIPIVKTFYEQFVIKFCEKWTSVYSFLQKVTFAKFCYSFLLLLHCFSFKLLLS